MRRIVLAAVLIPLLTSSSARAAGGHDPVGCFGCHRLTKNVDASSAAFCLKCHSSTEQGGRNVLPISKHVSHPYGIATVNPRVARVPPELLRADGRLECLSCHDPHPANRSYKYLRVDTAKGASMDAFCAVCHPRKSGRAPGAVGGKNPGT
jgi:predicted CXXCH cytochrome family protein